MIRIGDFSKMCKVTIKTLHHYDKIDLLKPVFINEENNYRYYNAEQLGEVAKIVCMKELGFSLDEIKLVFSDQSSEDYFSKMLKEKKAAIQERINQDMNRLAKINTLIMKSQEEEKMITIKKLPKVIVASKRVTIDSYDELFKVVPPMGDIMRKHGVECLKPEYCFNIYHDGEYKESDIDVEICEAVTKMHESKDGIVYKTIEAHEEAACIYHKGAYSQLAKSYGEIFKWIEENNYTPLDNPRESYIDGIWNKESEEEWLTEIQVPVKKNTSL